MEGTDVVGGVFYAAAAELLPDGFQFDLHGSGQGNWEGCGRRRRLSWEGGEEGQGERCYQWLGAWQRTSPSLVASLGLAIDQMRLAIRTNNLR